jgi:LmbE family N-acetylglucosaminyl deacetylase
MIASAGKGFGPMQTLGQSKADPMPASVRQTLAGEENLLVLAPRPGDESLHCGGLIARCCRRGRPPFVVVLTDGSTLSASSGHEPPDVLARRHEQETRMAMRCLGLPPQRLLLAGLFDEAVLASGLAFDALVRGITLVMWARDCNIICVATESQATAIPALASRVAAEVVRQSGVGLLSCQPITGRSLADHPGTEYRLDIAPDIPAKRAALAAHRTRFTMPPNPPSYEVFDRFEPPRIA